MWFSVLVALVKEREGVLNDLTGNSVEYLQRFLLASPVFYVSCVYAVGDHSIEPVKIPAQFCCFDRPWLSVHLGFIIL